MEYIEEAKYIIEGFDYHFVPHGLSYATCCNCDESATALNDKLGIWIINHKCPTTFLLKRLLEATL